MIARPIGCLLAPSALLLGVALTGCSGTPATDVSTNDVTAPAPAAYDRAGSALERGPAAGHVTRAPERRAPQTVRSGLGYFDAESSLLIRDTAVVNNEDRTDDPCSPNASAVQPKKWSFGYLLSQVAARAGIDERVFAHNWLANWAITTRVNGDTLSATLPPPAASNPQSLARRIYDMWQRHSGTGNTAGGPIALDLTKAPLRLLAIVNRFDLMSSPLTGEGASGASGELRFVFGVLDLDSGGGPCSQIQHGLIEGAGKQMLILEYAVDTLTAQAQIDWAQRWRELSVYPRGNDDYLRNLEQLTEFVVSANQAGDTRGHLIRIRTEESVDDFNWDMREFVPSATTKFLVPATVKQTPRDDLNHTDTLPGSSDLGYWINDNSKAIDRDLAVVPDQFPATTSDGLHRYTTKYFLGSHSTNHGGMTYWQPAAGTSVDAESRHNFSMHTCSGCHSAETGTFFFHINGREFNDQSELSGFLQGDGAGGPLVVSDPVNGFQREFNELASRTTFLLGFLGE